MSIETANAARFKKGMTVLSPLEGELLEALEMIMAHFKGRLETDQFGTRLFSQRYSVHQAKTVLLKAHGDSQDCEAP